MHLNETISYDLQWDIMRKILYYKKEKCNNNKEHNNILWNIII